MSRTAVPVQMKDKYIHGAGRMERQEEATPESTDTLRCPSDMAPGAKKEWRRVVGLYKKASINVYTDLDVAMLKAYCIEVDIRDRLYHEWQVEQGGALTVEQLKQTLSERANENGDYVPSVKTTAKTKGINPIIDQIAKHNLNIAKYADKLCLTPTGRALYAVREAKKEVNPLEAFLNNEYC